MPLHSENRTVKEDYWYTTAQLENVGKAWAKRGGRRRGGRSLRQRSHKVFKIPEEDNRTGLTQEDVDVISRYPHLRIMLPMNKGGNHWTAFAVKVDVDRTGRKTVDIKFTDSLSENRNFRRLPGAVQDEAARIGSLFQDAEVSYSIYEHGWLQEDAASCGPYSLENAKRALRDIGNEPNPGRRIIRERQLDIMDNTVAIKGCSTNNQLDEILRHWLIDKMSSGEEMNLSNTGIDEICSRYAEDTGTDVNEARQVFIDEYGLADGGVMRDYLARQRIGQLLDSDRDLHLNREQEAELERIRKDRIYANSMKSLEEVRVIFEEATGEEESYIQVANIIGHIAQGHQEEAFEKIQEHLRGDEDKINRCIEKICEVRGHSEGEKEFQKKLEFLEKTYQGIGEAIGNAESGRIGKWLQKMLNTVINTNKVEILERVANKLLNILTPYINKEDTISPQRRLEEILEEELGPRAGAAQRPSSPSRSPRPRNVRRGSPASGHSI